jgi:hypothetical protein
MISQSQSLTDYHPQLVKKTRKNKTNMQYNITEYFFWLIKKCKMSINISPGIFSFRGAEKEQVEGG